MKQILAAVSLFFAITSLAQSSQPHPGKMSSVEAELLFAEAVSAENNGKPELAIENDLKLIHQYPNFSKKMAVYQQLLTLYQQQKKSELVLKYAKEALLSRPDRDHYSVIQLLRIEANLTLGKLNTAKTVAAELLKTKPERIVASNALLLKAETVSRLGQHLDAIASLDAAKPNAKAPDTEVKVRARMCGAKKMGKKEDPLDFYRVKNICFKEIFTLTSKNTISTESSKVWCDEYKLFDQSLIKVKTDSFTREKIQKDLNDTKIFVNAWNCT